MKILLFAGAGTSKELGVPTMNGLATEFVTHVQQWRVEAAFVETIIRDTGNVEYLIEQLDAICEAENSIEAIGQEIDVEQAQRVRSEVEWFVQHCAERVTSHDAWLMWHAVLRATRAHDITFVTTNYDRAIELAAHASGISLNDGFADGDGLECFPWRGFAADPRGPMLVKLHGSTDWYTDHNTQKAIRLRHPMPLFGGGILQFDQKELGSSLVLPSRYKVLNAVPYPRLLQAFLNAVDDCDVGLFIGSSLSDMHVRDAAESVGQREGALFVVNPEGSACGIAGASVIPETASQFLLSTLPNALAVLESREILREACGTAPNRAESILEPVRRVLDPDWPMPGRCDAIDVLDSIGAPPPKDLIEELLRDTETAVARYALGLIPQSTSQEQLLVSAAQSPHQEDSTFRDEYRLLRTMIAE